MKKALLILTVAVLLLSVLLGACGSADEETKEKTTVAQSNTDAQNSTDDTAAQPEADTTVAPEADTEAPTVAPTEEATEADTEAPTVAPTEAVTSDHSALVGNWLAEIDIPDEEIASLASQIGLEEDALNGLEYKIYICMEFNADDTAAMYIDEEKTKASIESFFSGMTAPLVDMLYQKFADSGIDREDADEALSAQYGCTVAEYAEQLIATMSESLSNSTDFTEASKSGYYAIIDGKLYIENTVEELETGKGTEFELNGDTLILKNPDGESLFGMNSVTFERQ